jgi:hypothetical protein
MRTDRLGRNLSSSTPKTDAASASAGLSSLKKLLRPEPSPTGVFLKIEIEGNSRRLWRLTWLHTEKTEIDGSWT